ncbi:MAG: hypothetical protein AAF307_09775, partial [Pseudomonadota bacterium]
HSEVVRASSVLLTVEHFLPVRLAAPCVRPFFWLQRWMQDGPYHPERTFIIALQGWVHLIRENRA